MASRWTLFSGRFWAGWLDNLRISALGATLLPITTTPTNQNLIAFFLVAACYLAVVCFVALQIVRRRLPDLAVVLGGIALYGFLTLNYFVGRSHPNNLFRAGVPFALVVAGCGGALHRWWVERSRESDRPMWLPGAAAWAAVAVAVAAVVAHPAARAYPGLIHTAVAGPEKRGLCLYNHPDDVCGLPAGAHGFLQDFHDLADRLRSLGSASSTVAVLDQIGPVIQEMSGARPWGRYLPTFPALFTKAEARDVADDLRRDLPEFVVVRPRAEDAPYYADIWEAVWPPVRDHYVLDSQQGPFQIWRLRH
jgi:hypothetical protein